MGETAAWQSDERIAPGLHINRQGSEQGGALNDVGGGKSPNRRITAESFRLLSARLKKRPTAFANPELPPEPVAAAPVEVFQETVISAPVEEVEPQPQEELSIPDIEIEEPKPAAKKPWAWLGFDDPVEVETPEPEPEIEPPAETPIVEAAASQPEFEEPVQTPVVEEQALTPEPQEEIPFEELFAAPAEISPEPEPIAEPEPAHEPVAELELTAEPVAEPEPALEPVVELEPTLEPVVELELAPVPAASPEPAAQAEPAPQPVAEPEATPVPQAKSAASVETSVSTRRQPVDGKLGPDLLPTSGMVVPGIGNIAKAIYMTPTPADRAAFLAEVAAMLAAEAEAENAKSEIPSPAPSDPVVPAKPKVRRVKPEDDPFAKLDLAAATDNAAGETPDEDAGELARSLLDMMLSNPNAGQPQERALAADALLKLVPRIPLRSLVNIVDRLSMMDAPPHLLVSKLIHDPRIEVAGPLLELCNHISDQVLGKVVASGQVSLLRLIARRRHVSAALSDQLIEFDDPSINLTLVRNSGATFSHHAFPVLADHASRHHALLAPLATRPDLPAPIAFELFWFVPAELRRYLLSRFLTDSETMTKILKITHAMGGGEQGAEAKFPEREQVESLVNFLNSGNLPEATNILAEIAAIHPDNAARIISDANGEPLSIAFKAIGTNRAHFGDIIETLKNSDFAIISSMRSSAELQNIFDSMSFNKARVLLTYWDWAVMKSGPYAPAN